jgi:hypothetical protein
MSCSTEEKAAFMTSTDSAADITIENATEVDPYGRHLLQPYDPAMASHFTLSMSTGTDSDECAATLTTLGAAMPHRKKIKMSSSLGVEHMECMRESDAPCISSETTAEWVTVAPYREIVKTHFNQS